VHVCVCGEREVVLMHAYVHVRSVWLWQIRHWWCKSPTTWGVSTALLCVVMWSTTHCTNRVGHKLRVITSHHAERGSDVIYVCNLYLLSVVQRWVECLCNEVRHEETASGRIPPSNVLFQLMCVCSPHISTLVESRLPFKWTKKCVRAILMLCWAFLSGRRVCSDQVSELLVHIRHRRQSEGDTNHFCVRF